MLTDFDSIYWKIWMNKKREIETEENGNKWSEIKKEKTI